MKYLKLFCFSIIIFFIPVVYSMGLSTTQLRDTIFFEPNLEKTYTHYFVTNSGFTQDYETYTRMQRGTNLTQYVTIVPSKFEDVPTKARIPFTVYLNLPEKIDEPGFHEIRVGIRETQSLSGGLFGVRTGAEATITIIVLYPDYFIDWGFSTENINVNETATFNINIQNLGEPLIEEAYAKIRIYDSNNKIIKTIFTETKSIKPTETQKLTAKFNTRNIEPGSYKATAILKYDGNIEEETKHFLVGTLDVDLINYTKQFYANSTDEMDIKVKSGWNSKIENVFAEVEILDENKILQEKSFKTVSESLVPWETKTLKGYINTFGLGLKNYSINIKLNYDGESKTEAGKIEIIKAPEPEIEKASFIDKYGNTKNLLILIAALLIINMVWMLYRTRKKK